ncbi:MAG: hypothetical protein ACD_16C00079G0016 [uncultured bacterium]|nr:MAG: hypothetical protein ACD_16C00079G0016 [uncultured bacterium]OFW67969.1 MAG: ubiquinone biosynthesis protein UbiA [Alphaproteobacteria bacterium GWC2_42_16]OFW74671.1 MAG: ubiquinone biosynthesis protein UbiA [Alphaproteobacteria bacterium GWA2_41_27]OFW84976.1 MAG: ubiquinone biosynthesis protein UbiA [Alphaproteobacteria bacterium RIFCSPHIGHO2_12_FULL_42_100]OFW85557.1 MAG: ubiquinone biosynthesis protein UbiA [Alphaproteobacteria bacterium RBG_16_42_14]OFW91128.1 MAG: ubiquinone bio
MRRFFALSRTPHGILDIATPAFCALLWLGAFPPHEVILLALATAFSGYTAIYALNDLVGFQEDKKKFSEASSYSGFSVDASVFHHPIAQGLLNYRSGIYWATFWFSLALLGAYFLNPVIILILLVGAILEIIYCRLLKVTYLRTLISGVVKTCGPIAAIFVVTPSPSVFSLLLIFSWVFLWEIGGQNIPADMNDEKEDKRIHAQTIPVRFGANIAAFIILITLLLTTLISCFLPLISPLQLGIPYVLLSLAAGYYFLLEPAFQLYKTKKSIFASKLFDRASYYPLALLILISLSILFV